MIAQLFSSSINRFFSLSNNATNDFALLKGKTIELIVSHTPCHLYFTFDGHTVYVSKTTEHPVNTSIIGLPGAFAGMMKNHTFSGSGIRINGEIETAEAMKNLLDNIDIDWEEHLSQFTGDFTAHYAFNAAKTFLKTAKKATKTISSALSEIITEEKKWIMSKNELYFFLEEVDELQFSVDRLSVRIKNLRQRSTT